MPLAWWWPALVGMNHRGCLPAPEAGKLLAELRRPGDEPPGACLAAPEAGVLDRKVVRNPGRWERNSLRTKVQACHTVQAETPGACQQVGQW